MENGGKTALAQSLLGFPVRFCFFNFQSSKCDSSSCLISLCLLLYLHFLLCFLQLFMVTPQNLWGVEGVSAHSKGLKLNDL